MMPQLDAILAVTLAGLVLSATPGPSMLYVASRSIGQSRSAGLASAFGLGLGGVILAFATAFGLAAVFARFDWVAAALRYAGSAYLIWLGVDMIRGARANAQVPLTACKADAFSFQQIFWQGVLVEVLNPKTVLFFALFLPPFIDTGGGQVADHNIRLQLLVLGVLVPITAIPSDLLVAIMGSTLTRKLDRRRMFRERLAWAGGLILIGMAINLHLAAW